MSITPVARRAGRSLKPLDITFIVANVVGMAMYLKLASGGWRNPEEHGMVPVSGEPFVWASALPVLGVFFLANLAWAVVLLRRKEWKRTLWWALIGVLWLAAIAVDYSHH